MAYVDYDSLDSAEKAQVRQLDANEAIKANWRYKLVYAKDQTPESSPSSNASTPSSSTTPSATSSDSPASKPQEGLLPETGEKTIAGLSLIGIVCIGGALFLVIRKKTTSAKGLLLVLVATGALGLGTSVAKAYSGTVLKEAELVATDTVITPPAIAGYHYVGALSIPSGTVIARYVDTDGNTIADSVTVADEADVDSTYTTEQKTIEGYQFKEMAADSAATSGKVIDGTQTVTYVYEKLGTYQLYLDVTVPTPTTYDQTYDVGLEWWQVNNQTKLEYKGLLDPSNQTASPFDRFYIRLGHPLTVKYKGTTLEQNKDKNNTYSILVGTTTGSLGSPIQRIDTTDILNDITVDFNGNTYSLTAFNTYLSQELNQLYPSIYPNADWAKPSDPLATTTSLTASPDQVYQTLTQERYQVTLTLNVANESIQL
ncbi:hypothetical protein STRDD12_00501 [Streptococcus sp. DD12]|nr:hypothetical protein STRDD12_00501 [Streptococcus sp. DD12]